MKWYQSKTIWTNLTALLAGGGEYATSGSTTGLAVAIMGIINIVLRLVTKQPLE